MDKQILIELQVNNYYLDRISRGLPPEHDLDFMRRYYEDRLSHIPKKMD